VATPTTRALELSGPAGPVGVPVSVQVTSAGGWRPVIVLAGGAPAVAPFVTRLARAGFATVACDPRSPAELTLVLEALERGALGVDVASYGVLECAPDKSVRVSRVHAGARGAEPLHGVAWPQGAFEALCTWLLHELA
jgi:hypothetical protein